MSVGDRLARGDKAAQFSAGHTSANEPVEFRNSVVAAESEAEITSTFNIPVLDKRRHYNPLADESNEGKAAPQVSMKSYSPLQPVLDRILVKRIVDNPDHEILEDGSARDKRTGFIVPAKFRQHSNTGIVLATGSLVVLGGVRVPMSEIVKPGDKVTFGDYNSEIFPMEAEKEKRLCEALGLNYVPEDGSIRIVRVQDVRGVESAQ